MLTMKQFLILTAVFALMGWARAAQPAGVRQVSDGHAAVPTAASANTSATRQLTAEQRAELRRQLYQYSRLSGKGS